MKNVVDYWVQIPQWWASLTNCLAWRRYRILNRLWSLDSSILFAHLFRGGRQYLGFLEFVIVYRIPAWSLRQIEDLDHWLFCMGSCSSSGPSLGRSRWLLGQSMWYSLVQGGSFSLVYHKLLGCNHKWQTWLLGQWCPKRSCAKDEGGYHGEREGLGVLSGQVCFTGIFHNPEHT